MSPADDRWAAGDAYETFMGRWSRRLADRFIRWLEVDPGLTWLDVGCGTGALASTICRAADPAAVVACDPSGAFVEHVRSRILEPRISVVVAGAGGLAERPGGFDCVVAGLVLNFLPDPRRGVQEMRARARPGGVVAGYVWDYAGRMQLLRTFWAEAVGVDAAARELDEGRRFPMCRADALESVFREAGLKDVRSARECGKTLLVLDTANEVAERLYERLGWLRVGAIPGFALLPHGGLCGTTVYYRNLRTSGDPP